MKLFALELQIVSLMEQKPLIQQILFLIGHILPYRITLLSLRNARPSKITLILLVLLLHVLIVISKMIAVKGPSIFKTDIYY